MSEVKHGRVHSNIQWPEKPKCLCGAEGAKDPMWDRFYCPVDGVWLESPWGRCWCDECLKQIKAERAVDDILKG